MTLAATELFTDVSLDPHALFFLVDDIILQRYVEVEGERRRAIEVVKARASGHSKELRQYEITASGLVIGRRLAGRAELGAAEPEGGGPGKASA